MKPRYLEAFSKKFKISLCFQNLVNILLLQNVFLK
ncbi:hypothetical protein Avbf_17477 [Armadillidium vulgare]|nr:hypothetical protein Avbf_17477 [Armadillidium vulgare]